MYVVATRVTLADGTQEKIGKIVNQRMDVEVLSYDAETTASSPARSSTGTTTARQSFLQFTVAKSGRNGRACQVRTRNHLIRTPAAGVPLVS